MTDINKKSTSEKIGIFRGLFSGLTHVYGTYDPVSGRAGQVKATVTDTVIHNHLVGRQPYGVYLLMQDRTRAVAVDFDTENRIRPMKFVSHAKHYDVASYIERSKSKGYHVWSFFSGRGVFAYKARAVFRHILDEIEASDTEIFPKQDELNSNVCFGNFINAPLFGTLAQKGRTVFVDPGTFEPYPDQWAFLRSVKRIDEQVFDEIIQINDLSITQTSSGPQSSNSANVNMNRFSLPPCAQKMLADGVTRFQRTSCFRLAAHLKRLGLPIDVAIAALRTWALKNRPADGKRVITEKEIIGQIKYVFSRNYRGYGCETEAVAPFCQPQCPVLNRKNTQKGQVANASKDGFLNKSSDSPNLTH